MNFGKLTEIFGRHGIKMIWKMLLIWSAFAIFGRPQFIQNLMEIELGASFLTLRNLTAILLLLFFWMMHYNQY